MGALSLFFSLPLMELYDPWLLGLPVSTFPELSHLIHTQVLSQIESSAPNSSPLPVSDALSPNTIHKSQIVLPCPSPLSLVM